MKIIVSCLNSKYVHASLSPWCLLSGVCEFAKTITTFLLWKAQSMVIRMLLLKKL